MARYRRRQRWTTRELVEDSVVLWATDFRELCRSSQTTKDAKYLGLTGVFEVFGLRVVYAIAGDLSKIALLYRGSMGLPERQVIEIRLAQPVQGSDYRRAKFVCPRCLKTVNSIANPPRGGRFACVDCHNLTYESAQKAHRLDRLWAKFLNDDEFKLNKHQGALLWGISEIMGEKTNETGETGDS